MQCTHCQKCSCTCYTNSNGDPSWNKRSKSRWNIVKTKPDCVCREMKIGPWGEACWVKELRNEMRLQKFLGLLCSYNAADEAESISSLLMDGYSLHVYPYCAAQLSPLLLYVQKAQIGNFLVDFIYINQAAWMPCT